MATAFPKRHGLCTKPRGGGFNSLLLQLPHLGREVHKKTAQGSGAMNILQALGSPKGAV